MLPTWTYVKDADNLFVNMFLGSRITVPNIGGTDVEMIQETDYPWNGKVAINVNPRRESEFAIHIRVPNREVSELYTANPAANGIRQIKLNGNAIEPQVEKGYVVIKRTWQQGDTIEFELPMAVQRIYGDEKIAATRGQVALRYGPLIYTFESTDQSLDKVLPAEANLVPIWKPDLLGGVMAIEGTWADGSDLLAIPYYARANRITSDGSQGSFGGPGAEGGGNGARRQRGPSSRVWIMNE